MHQVGDQTRRTIVLFTALNSTVSTYPQFSTLFYRALNFIGLQIILRLHTGKFINKAEYHKIFPLYLSLHQETTLLVTL